MMQFGVPQGSILGPSLFLININDLHESVKFCSTRHFADDKNLLIANKSLKHIRKLLNLDLRFLSKWLRANKISLNCSKTELIIFRHPRKQINYELKLKTNGRKLYPSDYVKYLGILIDPRLNWDYHTDFIAPKLSRAKGMLMKIIHYIDANTLRSSILLNFFIYYVIWGTDMGTDNKQACKLDN